MPRRAAASASPARPALPAIRTARSNCCRPGWQCAVSRCCCGASHPGPTCIGGVRGRRGLGAGAAGGAGGSVACKVVRRLGIAWWNAANAGGASAASMSSGTAAGAGSASCGATVGNSSSAACAGGMAGAGAAPASSAARKRRMRRRLRFWVAGDGSGCASDGSAKNFEPVPLPACTTSPDASSTGSSNRKGDGPKRGAAAVGAGAWRRRTPAHPAAAAPPAGASSRGGCGVASGCRRRKVSPSSAACPSNAAARGGRFVHQHLAPVSAVPRRTPGSGRASARSTRWMISRKRNPKARPLPESERFHRAGHRWRQPALAAQLRAPRLRWRPAGRERRKLAAGVEQHDDIPVRRCRGGAGKGSRLFAAGAVAAGPW